MVWMVWILLCRPWRHKSNGSYSCIEARAWAEAWELAWGQVWRAQRMFSHSRTTFRSLAVVGQVPLVQAIAQDNDDGGGKFLCTEG